MIAASATATRMSLRMATVSSGEPGPALYRPRDMPHCYYARTLGLLLTLAASGCAASGLPIEPAATERNLEIVKLDAPESAKAGQPLTLTVTARLYGAGWRVGAARARTDEASRTIVIAGTAIPVPGAAPGAAAVHEETTSLTFTPQAAGTYRFEVPFGSERAKLGRTIRIMD